MKANELVKLGFRKKQQDGHFWYRRKIKGFEFITNDTLYNDGRDEWHIGVYTKELTDGFWFHNKLKTVEQFKMVCNLLTNKDPEIK